MKKNYETMEAYKVDFNANEQVAAAGCYLFVVDNKYGAVGVNSCEAVDAPDGSKYADPTGNPNVCSASTDGSGNAISVQYA